MQRLHLTLRNLEPARRPYDDDPVDLVQRKEQLEHPGQRGAPVQPDERLAAAAQPGTCASGGHDRAHSCHAALDLLAGFDPAWLTPRLGSRRLGEDHAPR